MGKVKERPKDRQPTGTKEGRELIPLVVGTKEGRELIPLVVGSYLTHSPSYVARMQIPKWSVTYNVTL